MIFGAGAIGQWLGALLASGGIEVQLHGRPRVAKAIAELGGIRFHDQAPVPVPFSTDLEELRGRTFTAVICTVKTFAVPAALEELKSAQLDFEHLFSFQNGWGTEIHYEEAFPDHKLWVMTTSRAVGVEGPGQLAPSDKGGLAIAPWGQTREELPPAQLRGVKIPLSLISRGLDLKWSKLMLNLIGNALGAVTGLSPKQLAAHPKLMKAELLLCRETLAVGRALGVDRVDLPGFPVRLFSSLIKTLPLGLVTPMVARKFRSARGDKLPSLFQDLEDPEKATEIHHLNGAVVAEGERLGVPTPKHRTLMEMFDRARKEPTYWQVLRDDPGQVAEQILGAKA